MYQDRGTEETVALVCAADLFRGATVVDVVALHQRSLCYRLRFDDGRSVFVKRALPTGSGGAVDQEVAVLRQLSGSDLPVPRLLAALGDPRAPVLVTEDVTGSGTLETCRLDAGGTSPAWARAAARSVAAIHAVPTGPLPGDFPRSDPARRLVRAWTVVSPREITRYASGFAEALRLLRGSDLVPLLRATADEWMPAAVVHGDIKSDNLLCGAAPEAPRPLALVDWEAGGLGDPRWDVGCLIGDLVFTWLSGIDLDAGPSLDDWIAAADPPFSAVRTDIAATVAAYEALVPVVAADRRLWVRFAAFFLLQRLCSAAIHSQVLPSRSLAYLQVAGQLLRRPDECAELLLCP